MIALLNLPEMLNEFTLRHSVHPDPLTVLAVLIIQGLKLHYFNSR